MGRVIQLSDHRARRARSVCQANGPPDGTAIGDQITIVRHEDGSRSVSFAGRYAAEPAYAIEALSEIAAALAGRLLRAR